MHSGARSVPGGMRRPLDPKSSICSVISRKLIRTLRNWPDGVIFGIKSLGEILVDSEPNGGLYEKDYEHTKFYSLDNTRSRIVCHGLCSSRRSSDN